MCDIGIYDVPMIELRFGEWLSDVMAEQRVTQTQLGEAVGVGQSAVSDWVSAKTYPSRKFHALIADTLGVDVAEIRQRIERERPARRIEGVRGVSRRGAIPFYGKVPADRSRFRAMEENTDVRYVPDEWVRATRHELIAVEASGDCLSERGINDGDVVVCERITDPSELPQGRVVLARIGDDVTLKIWYWTGESSAELRDGSGAVAASLTRADDIEIVGVARWRYGIVV